jgi:multiple sugar transport system permease protein
MVYPFTVMLGTSITSTVDRDEFRAVPAYLTDDTWLFRKYVEAKYNESLSKFNVWLSNELPTFKDLEKPPGVDTAGRRRQVAEWLRFRATLPPTDWMLGGIGNPANKRVTPEMLTRYRQWLQARYGTVEAVNRAYRQGNAIWELVVPLPERFDERAYSPMLGRDTQEFEEFKRGQPARFAIVISGDGLFQEWLRLKYGSRVADLNRAWGTRFASRFEARLAPRAPASVPPVPRSGGAVERPRAKDPAAPRATARSSSRRGADWEQFVRTELPPRFIALDPAAAPVYREFLRAKYREVALLNRRYGSDHAGFERVPAPDPPPLHGVAAADWLEFVERAAPLEHLSVRTPDLLYRADLRRSYGSLAALNAAYGTSYRSFEEPTPPWLAADWVEMERDAAAIRREFVVRNYRDVLNYIALHGPAIWNTFVLCAGLLLATLIVNPLCAYALSRYNLAATYKILLFLLATMAFPAEVSAIPNFLLLKNLHLLNTYWALILPLMANGYSIFLLKGFFDSLPKELYEAGTIDGASEATMFRVITLPLSRPVLAVIALGTFTVAYGSFLWAFLVCQDPKKWTLMVWLSQMQANSPMPVIFAALVLAAIPTLMVFIFCQNIIMRGIIVPTEK